MFQCLLLSCPGFSIGSRLHAKLVRYSSHMARPAGMLCELLWAVAAAAGTATSATL